MYTNRVNGKVYIGRTCQTLERRAGTQGNNYKSCHKFWNAIQKYGWDNFVPSILLDNLTFKEAALKEIEFINEYKSTDIKYGYNIIDSVSNDYSDKERLSLSEAVSKSMTPEHRKMLSQLHTGKKMSKEACQKMSKAKKGVPRGPRPQEVKDKIRAKLTGRKSTLEQRAKISEAKKGSIPWNKGKSHSESTRQKLREANLGKVIPNETRQKISQTMKTIRQDFNPMSKKVKCVETGEIYDTMTLAAKAKNISVSTVSKSVRGGKTIGYHWVLV